MAEKIILLLSDSRGVYIPQNFAEDFRIAGVDGLTESDANVVCGIDPDDIAILRAGPDHEQYWDVWDSVLSDAWWIDPETGWRYTLHQDGDLWAVAYDEMSDEEKEEFYGNF